MTYQPKHLRKTPKIVGTWIWPRRYGRGENNPNRRDAPHEEFRERARRVRQQAKGLA